MLRFLKILLAITLASLTAVSAEAQSGITAEQVWSFSGTPVGTERELNPHVTLTERNLFVGGSIQSGDQRRQVIQVFDPEAGRYRRTIEDVTGNVFAGHGEWIAANDRFVVTSTYRPPAAGSGFLQVYDAQSGAHLRTIPNPRAGDSSRFGQLQVSLEGSRILAGVGLSDDNLSTSWLFDAETGDILMTIDEPDNQPGLLTKAPRTLFGFANALTETHILIAANQKTVGDMQGAGVVYLFDAQTGKLLQTFQHANPEQRMMFGSQVAMNDKVAIISALRDSGPLNWSGIEINAYDLTTGALLYTLSDPFTPQTNEGVLAGDYGSDFGRDFALWNNMLIIGAPGMDGANEDSGAILFYDALTGESSQGIFNENGLKDENFGQSIAVERNLMTVVSTPEIEPFKEITRIDGFRLGQN